MKEKAEKIVTENTKKDGYYKSQKIYSKNYDKNEVDQVRVRVPKGWNDKMKEYVNGSDKYKSVNDMINKLIAAEIPGIQSEE